MRSLTLLFVSVLSAGCGVPSLLPDGGRPRFTCGANSFNALVVTVKESNGALVADATVTGTVGGSSKTQSGTTNANGVTTALNEDLGVGQVTVVATQGGRQSSPGQAMWTCDECDCTVTPKALTLTFP